MLKFIGSLFTLIGIIAVLGVIAVTVAVAMLWWQDKQWQAKAAQNGNGSAVAPPEEDSS